MDIFYIVLGLLIGLVILIESANFFVDSAVKISEISGIPKLIIGATIVSLATTLPEFFTSMSALFSGSSEANDMAVGNAFGSIIFNTSVILSIAAIFMPGDVERKNISEKIIVLYITLFSLYLFSSDRKVVWFEGLVLLLFVIIYTILNVMSVKNQKDEPKKLTALENKQKIIVLNLFILIISATGIYLGSKLLVNNSVSIAKIANVEGRIISLTIMAIGTSLPELTTTITSVIKKEQSLSIGNVFGANVLNVTLVLGSCGLFASSGLAFGNNALFIDLPLIFSVIALFAVPIIIFGKIKKWQGIFGLLTYLIYITYLLVNI